MGAGSRFGRETGWVRAPCPVRSSWTGIGCWWLGWRIRSRGAMDGSVAFSRAALWRRRPPSPSSAPWTIRRLGSSAVSTTRIRRADAHGARPVPNGSGGVPDQIGKPPDDGGNRRGAHCIQVLVGRWAAPTVHLRALDRYPRAGETEYSDARGERATIMTTSEVAGGAAEKAMGAGVPAVDATAGKDERWQASDWSGNAVEHLVPYEIVCRATGP